MRTGAASARNSSPAASSTAACSGVSSRAPWTVAKLETVIIMGQEYMRDYACQRVRVADRVRGPREFYTRVAFPASRAAVVSNSRASGGRCRRRDTDGESSRNAASLRCCTVASIIDTVANLAKRRGLVFQSGEIYGGTKSAWDYGPLGVELKENIKRQWWRSVVTGREDVVGLDSAIILPREVWVASGHVEVFNDPLVESLITHKRYRADHLIEAYEAKHGHPPPNGMADIRDPETGDPGQWTEPRDFNMMLKTHLGPIETEEGMHYLRPETAQGIFVNFANVVTTSRRKPPFGIGQIGKSFRNEITPGNFIFRTREFEQMEMEFFVEPATAAEWHQYWIDTRLQWYVDLGIDRENLRLYEHPKDKLSHYSTRTVDIEYKFGFQGNPWGELEGVANRTDFDLSTHSKHSGVDLSFYDQATDTRYVPYVIEPAAGLTRSLMAFLVDAYTEDG